MTGLLRDKVVVVTGAGRGIGAAAAELFAREGASLVLASRTLAQLEAVAEEVRGLGAQARVHRTDVTVARDLEALFSQALQTFSKVDGVFACAGLEAETPSIVATSEEAFERVVGGNLRATWLTLRAAAGALGEGGAIVTTSSIASVITDTRTGVYAAAKSGINRLTQVAARELGARGIRVNTLAPGATRTAMIDSWEERSPGMTQRLAQATPLGRLAEPSEVAQAAAWLLSDRASFVNGAFLLVDGGMSA